MDLIYRCNKKIGITFYTYQYNVGKKAGSCRPGPARERASSYRIVQVSDLQSEYFGEAQRDLLSAVRAAGPDQIVLTGDLIDRSHTNYPAAMTAVRGLAALAPVCYIAGNHELDLPREDYRKFLKTLEKEEVPILLNKVLPAGSVPGTAGIRVNLLGLSEYTVFLARNQKWGTGHRQRKDPLQPEVLQADLAALVAKVDPGDLNILLAHEPQYFDYYVLPGIDVVLAGHAHGGQFRLPNGQGLFAPGQGELPKYTEGAHRIGDTTMIISRGLGNSSFPLRLNNPPELVSVDLVQEG